MKSSNRTSAIPFALLILLLSFNQCSEDPEPDAACTTNAFPSDGSLVAAGASIGLSWSSSPGVSIYDVYLGSGTNAPELIAENVPATTAYYDLPSNVDVTYTWYVQPKNSSGKATGCSTRTTTFKAVDNFPLDEEE